MPTKTKYMKTKKLEMPKRNRKDTSGERGGNKSQDKRAVNKSRSKNSKTNMKGSLKKSGGGGALTGIKKKMTNGNLLKNKPLLKLRRPSGVKPKMVVRY